MWRGNKQTNKQSYSLSQNTLHTFGVYIVVSKDRIQTYHPSALLNSMTVQNSLDASLLSSS